MNGVLVDFGAGLTFGESACRTTGGAVGPLTDALGAAKALAAVLTAVGAAVCAALFLRLRRQV